jgi:hypothetical protein
MSQGYTVPVTFKAVVHICVTSDNEGAAKSAALKYMADNYEVDGAMPVQGAYIHGTAEINHLLPVKRVVEPQKEGG